MSHTNSKEGGGGRKSNLIVKLETVSYLKPFRDHLTLECLQKPSSLRLIEGLRMSPEMLREAEQNIPGTFS